MRKSKVALCLKLIIILCFASISRVENDSYKQDLDGSASLGHYLSSLPGGVSLEDVSSGKAYSYGELPPLKKKKEKKNVCHTCEYCMKMQRKKSARRRTYSRKGMFSWPISADKFWISCYYGRKSRGRLHKGIDLAAIAGTPIRASAPGIVEQATYAGTFGNMVLIRHGNGYKTRYAHLQSISVSPGKFVPRGKFIGRVGNTGRVSGKTGHHLHFEVLHNNVAINPMRFLA